MIEHPRDDLAAYTLGALDDAEARAIDAHLATCGSCRAEVDAYRAALVAYAAASDARVPDARERIVSRARGTGRRENAWTSWLRRPVPAFVPAALVVLLIASLVAIGQLRGEADAYANALAAIPSAHVVTLTPSSGSDLAGALVLPESGTPYLLLRVPAPPEGKAWQAWVLRADAPAPAGLARSGGVVTLTLTTPLSSGEGVAVTLEPASGSRAPTSTPVLVLPRAFEGFATPTTVITPFVMLRLETLNFGGRPAPSASLSCVAT